MVFTFININSVVSIGNRILFIKIIAKKLLKPSEGIFIYGYQIEVLTSYFQLRINLKINS